MKVAGNSTTPINHLNVDGIYGKFKQSVFRIWTDSEHLSSTDVKTCNIDNIGAMPGESYRAVEVKTVGGGSGVNIDNMSIGIISGDFSGSDVPVISVTTGTAGNSSVSVHNLSCICPRNVACFLEVGGDGAGSDVSRIDNLEISFDAAILNANVPEGYGVKVTRGQINNLTMDGSITLSSGQSVLRKSGGKISMVTYNNLNQINGFSCYATTGNFDSSTPTFKFIGGSYTSPDKLISLVTGYSVEAAGATVFSKIGEIFYTTAGVVKVQGQLLYGNSCIPTQPAAGVTWLVKGFGISADVNNIGVNRGGYCYNTNPSLAGGVGPVAADGASWVSII